MNSLNDVQIIGFAGTECYDIVLYLSRILYHLNKKVLLIDLSKEQSLGACIPIPNELKNKLFNYRGVEYSNDFLLDQIRNKDFVVIYFGHDLKANVIELCKQLIFVTDLQKHNVDFVKKYRKMEKCTLRFLIRDTIRCKITPRYIKSVLKIYPYDVMIQKRDMQDMECMIQSQYDNAFRFKRISPSFRDILYKLLDSFDIEEKAINKIIRKAERGK